MSDPIHHLRMLHNNPFIFAPAFGTFFKNIGEKDRGLLLTYLLLPMVLYPPSHKFLHKANSRSSLRTMLQDRGRIHGLDERVARYRHVTNTTIQYLRESRSIMIDGQLVVAVATKPTIEGPSPEGMIKAARNLGVFFKPYDVPTVFRMLGVMSL